MDRNTVKLVTLKQTEKDRFVFIQLCLKKNRQTPELIADCGGYLG